MPIVEDPAIMEPMLVSAGALSALVAGVTGSLHCALMCGPLACASRGSPLAWHVGRVTAYSFVGLLLGALGRGVSSGLRLSVQPWLPWVMAAGLVITALDLARHARPIPGMARISGALVRAGARVQPSTRSFLAGAATPFLPCGLLYGLFLAAMATGTPWGGATVMGTFALGAIPAIAALQLGARRVTLSPKVSLVARRVVPLAAAVVLVVRALLTRADVAKCG